jgi:hypothetical protein
METLEEALRIWSKGKCGFTVALGGKGSKYSLPWTPVKVCAGQVEFDIDSRIRCGGRTTEDGIEAETR